MQGIYLSKEEGRRRQTSKTLNPPANRVFSTAKTFLSAKGPGKSVAKIRRWI
jgi:hypothetical protein